MAKFGVTLTMIYNGYMEVEAATEEEARRIAEDNLSTYDFDLGEITIDNIEKIENE